MGAHFICTVRDVIAGLVDGPVYITPLTVRFLGPPPLRDEQHPTSHRTTLNWKIIFIALLVAFTYNNCYSVIEVVIRKYQQFFLL